MEIVLIKYLSIEETGMDKKLEMSHSKCLINVSLEMSQKMFHSKCLINVSIGSRFARTSSQKKNGAEKIIFQVVPITKMEFCI